MRVREERVRQIAERITDALLDDELIDWNGRLEALNVKVEKVILDDLAMYERISQEASDQIATYSRDIPTGTTEWMLLHEKAMDDLAIKYNYYLR